MLAVLFFAGLALNLLVWWFASLEARGERHTILVVLALVVLIEAVLAGPASEVPRGILRPAIGGQDFRPPDAVIVAAMAARILNLRGHRVSTMAMWWSAFLAMYVTSSLVGILNGFPIVEVLFQGKGGFYLIGGMTIASGADPKRLADTIGKLSVVGAVIVFIAFVIEALNVRIAFAIPGQRFNRLGNLSNDTITLMILVGILCILIEATRERPRPLYVGTALVLLLSPAAGHQRASYLVLAACLLMLAVLFFGPTWKQRSRVTLLEVSLVFAGLIAIAGVNFVVNDGADIVAPLEEAFSGEAEQRSAESRFSLASQALGKIQERPVLGWGTGIKVIRQAQLSNREVAAAAHNIVLDLGMRVGVVGLGLFIAAVWVTTAAGLRTWRNADSTIVAAVAAAGTICMWAVISKGMVEPALDKFRLSLSMGISIGLVMAAYRPQLLAEEDVPLVETNAPEHRSPSPPPSSTERPVPTPRPPGTNDR